MFDQFTQAKMSARAIIEDALALCISKGSLLGEAAVTYTIEVPKDSDKGDLACNVALVGAKQFREAPAKISEILTEAIGEFPEDSIFQKIEIAGPGFINFFFSSNYYENALSGIITAGSDYGKTAGKGAKYMVEYVSANPTGPMHLGNARGGALGDCLAGILEMAGYDIFREFYVNDAGGQIEKFAVSLESRYLQIYDSSIEFPEGGYLGQDIIDRAEEFAEIHGSTYIGSPSNERKEALVNYALPVNIENMKNDLMRYRIEYQLWFYESTLHINNTIEKVMDILKNRDLIYTMDGAVWYKATEYGGEKDEVMVRSNGYYTYFAVDVAYHYNKFVERGFDTVINIWGADHHGHVARLKGAMDAIGLSGDKLHIVLVQMVTVLIDGKPAKLSKRSGKAITLTTLLDDVPIDAARFFFNLREPKSQLEFDLDLAVKQSSDNPVYYVQYAHARICSILKGLTANGILLQKAFDYSYTSLVSPEEKALIRYLSYLPGEVDTAAREFNPARITRYTIELATLFHRFYTACRVKGEADEVMYPRIALCIATRQVLQNCLKMLKISAPESM